MCQVWLNDPIPFLHFCDYLPFEEDLVLYLNKLEFTLSKNNLYQVWLNLACWFCRRRFLKISVYFYYFVIISHWRRAIPFFWTSPLPPKDDLCQVWLKLAQWFWRKFLNDLALFWHFCDYLPFEEELALYLTKTESPSPKNNLYQVWLNLACWFWRRRFLKKFSAFLLFCYYLPLEMDNPFIWTI